ncbi:MAG TPA: 1-deoxy-D-xylulose-5-phosphate synthase [bacterium]
MSILENIKNPNDLKELSLEQLQVLCQEIRNEMIQTCSKTGGHLAPSLGVVELTLALYRVFDAEQDKIIWDVGHQTYAQKLVTGRYAAFKTLRKHKGISGFPKRKESRFDVFDTGHSSTSLSAAAGFVLARDLNNEKYKIISVIGDGSLATGMAFEALNHIGHMKKDVMVVLNDNERSIGESVGALSQYLTKIITTRTYNRFRDDLWMFIGKFPPYMRERGRNFAKRIQEGLKGLYAPAVIFEELGFRYIGPLDGHKLNDLIDTLTRVKDMKGPRLVHVVTRKGKGYKPAEDEPERFHGIGAYDVLTGKEKPKQISYTDVFGDALLALAKQNPKIVAITAGMCLGTGLARFREELPDRFFDVGITEQHAVTTASALALAGYIPVCAIYSTFLQRAYDQIIHDVCLQKAPVVFCVDRAGLVGEDGPTHHGPFDLSFFGCVPNTVVSAPKDGEELIALLKTAVNYRKGPFVIRYPRGSCSVIKNSDPAELKIGTWEVIHQGGKNDLAILAIGSMVQKAVEALPLLQAKGYDPLIINARFAKPLDTQMLKDLLKKAARIVTIEENAMIGGFGSAVTDFCRSMSSGVSITTIGLPDNFVEHGPREVLLKTVGLDAQSIVDRIKTRKE